MQHVKIVSSFPLTLLLLLSAAADDGALKMPSRIPLEISKTTSQFSPNSKKRNRWLFDATKACRGSLVREVVVLSLVHTEEHGYGLNLKC